MHGMAGDMGLWRRHLRQGRHTRPRPLQIVSVAHPHRRGEVLYVPRTAALAAGLRFEYHGDQVRRAREARRQG